MERDNRVRGNEDHHQDRSRLVNPPPSLMIMQTSSDGQRGHQQQQQHHQQQQQQQVHQPQKCPRCESMNTKFCYYNNYSLSQPRYFCKTCRRYWTQGGTLRNVPVGGGCRKGRRTKTSSASSSTSSSTSGSEVTSLVVPPQNTIQPQAQPQPPILASSSNPLGLLGSNLAPSYYYPIGGSNSSGSGGSFLSSLAAMTSLHQGLSGGGYFSTLSGNNNINYPIVGGSYNSSQRQKQELYSNQPDVNNNMNPIFTRNNTAPEASDSIELWSTNVGGASGSRGQDSDSNSIVGSSLNPRRWPDLPRYGPPP